MASPEVEKTLALIKPDAVRAGKAEEIKQLIELHGFTIVAQQKLQLTRARAEEFYGEHYGKPFFPTLVNFMTSGPIWALVLAKPDAIKGWRELMGPTNVFKAREEKPRSLRALYGTDGTQNATHGSDSPTSAAREVKFFFPGIVLEPVMDADAAKAYITEKLQPALARALTALARTKPSAEKFEAITFLASYLLNNNPNKPRILTPDEWDPSVEEEDDEAEFMQARLAALQQQAATQEAARAAEREAAEAAAAAAKAAEEAAASAAEQARLAAEAAAAKEAQAAEAARVAALERSAAEYAAVVAAHNQRTVAASQQRLGELTAGADTTQAPAAPAAVSDGAGGATAGAEGGGAELEAAATTIQAAFRSYQGRKEAADTRGEDIPVLPSALPPTTLELPGGLADREAVLRAVFSQLDRDGSGFIDKEEFKHALNAMGKLGGGPLTQQLDTHLSAMDANGDSKVSQDEFLEHMGWVSGVLEDDANFANYIKDVYNITLSYTVNEAGGATVTAAAGFSSREEVLDAAFKQLDRDSSGFIDKEEFKAALSQLGTLEEGRVAEQAGREVEAMDANGDNKISKDEFVEHMSWLSGVLSDEEFYIYLADAFHLRVDQDYVPEAEEKAAAEEPAAPAPAQDAEPAAAPVDREAVLDLAFAQLDHDSSGFIDRSEFKRALTKLGESDVRVAEQAGQLMEMMDQNGDDKVSKVEFLEHMGFVRGTLNDAEFLQYLTDAFAVKVHKSEEGGQFVYAARSFRDAEMPAATADEDEQGQVIMHDPSQGPAGGAEDDAEPSEPSGPLDRSLVLNTAWDDMDRTGSGAVDKAVLRHALVTLGELAGSAVGEQVAAVVDGLDAAEGESVGRDVYDQAMSSLSSLLEDDKEFEVFMVKAFGIKKHVSASGARFTYGSKSFNQGSAAAQPADDEEEDNAQVIMHEPSQAAADEAPAPDQATAAEEVPDLASFTEDQIQAVTKIQAAGRGMLDRKKVKALKADTGPGGAAEQAGDEEAAESAEPTGDEEPAAAEEEAGAAEEPDEAPAADEEPAAEEEEAAADEEGVEPAAE